MDAPLPAHTFIVRIGPTAGGGHRGTVQRVRTGEKHRFETVARTGTGGVTARRADHLARHGTAFLRWARNTCKQGEHR